MAWAVFSEESDAPLARHVLGDLAAYLVSFAGLVYAMRSGWAAAEVVASAVLVGIYSDAFRAIRAGVRS